VSINIKHEIKHENRSDAERPFSVTIGPANELASLGASITFHFATPQPAEGAKIGAIVEVGRTLLPAKTP
jgi:hypothetical protein